MGPAGVLGPQGQSSDLGTGTKDVDTLHKKGDLSTKAGRTSPESCGKRNMFPEKEAPEQRPRGGRAEGVARAAMEDADQAGEWYRGTGKRQGSKPSASIPRELRRL